MISTIRADAKETFFIIGALVSLLISSFFTLAHGLDKSRDERYEYLVEVTIAGQAIPEAAEGKYHIKRTVKVIEFYHFMRTLGAFGRENGKILIVRKIDGNTMKFKIEIARPHHVMRKDATISFVHGDVIVPMDSAWD